MRGRSDITCVLASGGLDSAVLLARLLRAGGRVWPVYLRCGLAWEAAELYWLRRFLRAVRSPALLPLSLLDVPVRGAYGAHWSITGRGVPGARSADAAVELPGRNGLLLTHAALAAARRGVTRLAVGTLRGNPFRDASPRFFRTMAAGLTQALGRPIRIAAPLRRLTKRQLIRSSASLPLALTFSCLNPSGVRPCGACNKCAERRRAFRDAGVTDPTRYASR
jgi:7-cyano-7-deazaguanine synthase